MIDEDHKEIDGLEVLDMTRCKAELVVEDDNNGGRIDDWSNSSPWSIGASKDKIVN